MNKLKVNNSGGDNQVQSITMLGNPKKPEPHEFRIFFPCGYVSVSRTKDNKYWVHIGNRQELKRLGKVIDARLDIKGKHVSESNTGDFDHPDLYHAAIMMEKVNGG